jgi:hypothetical protein
MAGQIRYLTNEAIPFAASNNNYMQAFTASQGAVSSIDLILRATFPTEPVFTSDFGIIGVFSRIKVSVNGRVVFDAYQTSNLADAYQFDEVDFIRSSLNGETDGQYVKPSLATDVSYNAKLRIPMMESFPAGARVQVQYDTLDFATDGSDIDPTSLVADVACNYVDSLQGKYETRRLPREQNMPITGNTILQLPTVAGYALESIMLKSTTAANAKADQFGENSRITLGDINGNTILDEASGVELTGKWHETYGDLTLSGLQKAAITDFQKTLPTTALTGVVMIDAGQVVGNATLKLTPSAAVENLDVMCVFVARQSGSSANVQAKALQTSVDAIGEGVETQSAI